MSVTGTLRGEPPAPPPSTVTVALYVPGARPAGFAVTVNVAGAAAPEADTVSHGALASR